MTTILGVKVSPESGEEGVVLGSDTQVTVFKKDGVIDSKKKGIKKIVSGKNWAIAHSGDDNKYLEIFNRILQGRKRYHSSAEIADGLVERAVSEYTASQKKRKTTRRTCEDFFTGPHFHLVNLVNSSTLRKYDMDEEDNEPELNTFLLATCPPKVGLWYIDSHGNMREVSDFGRDLEYLTMGSGSERVDNYIKGLLDDDRFDPSTLTIPDAIDIVTVGLHRAVRDPYTGGPLDLIILASKGVDPCGDNIRAALSNAEKKQIEEIKARYQTS